MGIDLAVYRVRIGNFVQRNTDKGLSNIAYLVKAIGSVRGELVRSCQYKGSVYFIDQLLLRQGVEPNPGPHIRDKRVKSSATSSENVTDAERPQADETDSLTFVSRPQSTEGIRSRRRQNTGNTRHHEGYNVPSIQTVAAGDSSPNTGHLSGETIDKMVIDHSALDTEEKIPSTRMATDPGGGATQMTLCCHGGSSGPMMTAQPQEETTIVQVYNQKIGKMNVSFQGGETAVLGDNNTINITKPDMDDKKGAILEDIQQKVSNIEKDVNRMVAQPKTPMSIRSRTNVPARKEFNLKPEKQKKGDKEVSAERKHAEGSAEVTIAKCIDDSDDVMVIRSRAEQAVVQCLKNYNMVFITGVTGEGKTTLAAKIMKDLRDGKLDETFAPKTPVRVFIPEDWTKVVVDNEEDVVVFVDDVFGTSNYQVDLLNRWKPVFKAVEQALDKKKVLLLLTSRTHILADARRDAGITDDTNDHILSVKKVVDITHKYQLTFEERRNMLGNYASFNERFLDSYYSIALQQNRSIGFPLVCSLFFNDDELFEKGNEFFQHPDRLLNKEIEKMSMCDKGKYFALVYCFLQPKQKVDIRNLDPLKMSEEEKQTLKVYAEICGVECFKNHTTLLKESLNSLRKNYLSCEGTVYKFSHESVAENVCLVFSSQNPKVTLEKCSNRVILELLDLSQTGQKNPPNMVVPENCFGVLSERIYKMVTNDHSRPWRRLTLESFSRFQNEAFASHFFKYLSEHKKIKEMISVHVENEGNLLAACANNAAFLSALFRYNVDTDLINKCGALYYTACTQYALHLAVQHKNTKTMLILVKRGAIYDTDCLRYALRIREDEAVKRYVLSGNMWITSEVEQTRKSDQAIIKYDVSSLKQKFYYIRPLHIERQQGQWNQGIHRDMTEEENPEAFQYMLDNILATAPNSEKRKSLLRTILESKGKRLSDLICIRRILGPESFDVDLIQHALYRCNPDMIRFLVLSTTLTVQQLDDLLSLQVHFCHHKNIEILYRAGGRFNPRDFIQMSGICGDGISQTIDIMKTLEKSFSRNTFSEALKSALCSGSKSTIRSLSNGGAKCDMDRETIQKILCREGPDTVDIVSDYIDTAHLSSALDVAVRFSHSSLVKTLISRGGKLQDDALVAAVCRTSEVYDIVKLVASAKKWSRGKFTRALSKAVEICRPDVIKFLHIKGGDFRENSLQHVLKWNVEHHVKEKIVCYMLMSREWTPNLIQAAMITAVERLFVTGSSGKAVGHVLISLVLHREGNIPNYIGKQSNDIHDIIGILENPERSNREVLEAILSRSVQYGRRDVVARLIENGYQCCNQCLVYSVGSKGIQNSERQELVQLVRKNRDWPDSVQTEALDKALQCGLEDTARYLHDNGAKFGDKSLLNAKQADCYDYDPLSMVEYILSFEEEYEATQLAAALVKSIDCCNYEVMVELHRHGAKFPDGSLKQIICRKWKSSDRMRAVEYACQTRQWALEERQNALLEAIKIGDIPMSRCIIGIGARFIDRCLAETMEKKMKPSHRLCMVKFIISRKTITTEEIERARLIADKRSETKLATFLLQAKAT